MVPSISDSSWILQVYYRMRGGSHGNCRRQGRTPGLLLIITLADVDEGGRRRLRVQQVVPGRLLMPPPGKTRLAAVAHRIGKCFSIGSLPTPLLFCTKLFILIEQKLSCGGASG